MSLLPKCTCSYDSICNPSHCEKYITIDRDNYINTLSVLKTIMTKAGLELGAKKCDELIESATMTLPQQTKDRINKDADKYAFHVPYNGTNEFYNKDLLKGYKAGATAEATRALGREKVLVEALEEVMRLRDLWQYNNGVSMENDNEVEALTNMEDKVKSALASYKEKEGGK